MITVPNSLMTETLASVKGGLTRQANDIVPWFFENMHPYYFSSHTQEEIQAHLQGIISGEVLSRGKTLLLESPCGSRTTYIVPGTEGSKLISILSAFKNSDLQTIRIYCTKDNKLRLCTFHKFPQSMAKPDMKQVSSVIQQINEEKNINQNKEQELTTFLSCASLDYIERFDPDRYERHNKVIKNIQNTQQVYVQREEIGHTQEQRLTIAMIDPPNKGLILNTVKTVLRAGFEISRGYSDLFDLKDKGLATIISLYVYCPDGSCGLQEQWDRLKRELKWVKWINSDDLEWFADEKKCSIAQVHLLESGCKFIHQFLLRKDPYAYTLQRIKKIIFREHEISINLIKYFEYRFNPDIIRDNNKLLHIEKSILNSLELLPDQLSITVLHTLFDFFKSILKCNYFVDNPFGLSFRIDSKFIKNKFEGETPFGLFYFNGPGFHGFHVRYSDMARGGVRLVRTKSVEQYELENKRLFDEVTALAGSQHFKNKDIPEGGAKAVLLLESWAGVDLAVKSMANSLLDIILSTKGSTTMPDVVDYLGMHEIIYLGPDENISSRHINWMIARAEKRGYSWPQAFMSSKPEAGINHKQYGVTSLGVVVYVEEILKTLGINPFKQDFTIKMTGGPAGDVAGNAIRILNEDFGDKAKIVAITDGHGAAYDQQGLDHEQLLLLVEQGLRIHNFPVDKLKSPDAFVIKADTPEGARIRNTLHNTALADIFIPAGGRPDTINIDNWKQFLTKSGMPSAKAIVEGANIFISNEARNKLEEQGILFLHGSSANKTGVICSSYEILAGLILSPQEFLEIKDEYVSQLLRILAKRARDEARLIAHEYRYSNKERYLTAISFDIAKEINELANIITTSLFERVQSLHEDMGLCELIFEYCPPVLVERYKDRIIHKMPVRYQFALLGAFIASKIVYREGLGWLKRMSKLRDMMDIIHTYLDQDKQLRELMLEVSKCEKVEKKKMIKLLKAKGRKYFTAVSLGLD